MKHDMLLRRVAPCGLVCHTCLAAKGGIIQQHGEALLRFLDGFERYAEMLAAMDTRFRKYQDFHEVLEAVKGASCQGCRDGIAKFPGCEIAACAQERGHDFCFQCDAFPCDRADREPLLKVRWLKANKRMRAVGVETYLQEEQQRSHYV